MTICEINAVNYGSTGNIMLQIADTAKKSGNTVYILYPKSRNNKKKSVNNSIEFGSYLGRHLHVLLALVSGLEGCFSYILTCRLLRKINKINPDLIHLHNLHGNYINLKRLFFYIKKKNIPVVWTLHDCWSFTGHCPYFDMANCNKWEIGCHDCTQYRSYPASLFDNSGYMWKLKKNWFTGINNLTFVTPSRWLADLVKKSFLREYPVKVINNGIDLTVFKPSASDFRAKYGISDNKFILLGVAFGWSARKGLDIFIELSKRLDECYQIVLVGTTEDLDKQLPKNIISIHKTHDQKELAAIYTAADLFVNPTREDNFPTVNMESIACGTPVLTFKTGGCSEVVDDTCGSVVEKDDIDKLESEIVQICKDTPYNTENCLNRAKTFDMNDKYREYVDLYKVILK